MTDAGGVFHFPPWARARSFRRKRGRGRAKAKQDCFAFSIWRISARSGGANGRFGGAARGGLRIAGAGGAVRTARLFAAADDYENTDEFAGLFPGRPAGRSRTDRRADHRGLPDAQTQSRALSGRAHDRRASSACWTGWGGEWLAADFPFRQAVLEAGPAGDRLFRARCWRRDWTSFSNN